MSIDSDDVLRRAWELREAFRKRGEFTMSDYRRELGEVLPDLTAEQLDTLAQQIDTESARQKKMVGEFDIGGEYQLRGGRRVAKAKSLWKHAVEVSALAREQIAALDQRN